MSDRIIPACAGNSQQHFHLLRSTTDHPRVCGEQVICPTLRSIPNGSSPRVRGTVRQRDQLLLVLRIIPACAGNRTALTEGTALTADHPRVCGEQYAYHVLTSLSAGSSPRVRGTGAPLACPHPLGRIIPACAGNSCPTPRLASTDTDHPRVCGEQTFDHRLNLNVRGSSPRVRGTVRRKRLPATAVRIIPACAGNSLQPVGHNAHIPDHPRVCGEQTLASCIFCKASGSSPRVRGTESSSRMFQPQGRIIPACAGNRAHSKCRFRRQTDHPRVCGEQAGIVPVMVPTPGSSPRVRGTAGQRHTCRTCGRIIPACAGNRKNCVSVSSSSPDHPRVCGEQLKRQTPDVELTGSSPRVRGTEAAEGVAMTNLRIIPACAGNSTWRPASRRPSSDHPRVCGEQ